MRKPGKGQKKEGKVPKVEGVMTYSQYPAEIKRKKKMQKQDLGVRKGESLIKKKENKKAVRGWIVRRTNTFFQNSLERTRNREI